MTEGVRREVGPDPTSTAFPAVDTFGLAGGVLPGKWTLTDATKKFGWQIQQGYGLSGAVVFPKGDELIVAKFKGEFWAHADYLIFTQIRKRLLIKPAVLASGLLNVSALGINHPELRALGVTAVVVGEITPVTKIDETGLWGCTIDFLQYRAPRKAPPIPETIIPDTTPQGIIGAKQSQEVEMQNLEATLNGLKGR